MRPANRGLPVGDEPGDGKRHREAVVVKAVGGRPAEAGTTLDVQVVAVHLDARTEGRETRDIDGRTYVLEYPIKGDVALIGAWRSDGMGNLVYRKTARNFGPVMAAAARTTIVEVPQVVATGELDGFEIRR